MEVEHRQSFLGKGKTPLAVDAVERRIEYLKDEEDGQTIACFTEAIPLSPRFADAYLARARACDEKGDFDLVIAEGTEVIRLNPERARGYRPRGQIYGKTGQWGKAERDVAKARRIEARQQ